MFGSADPFQITLPTGGFWGVGLKPWDERTRSVFQILPEATARVASIPGVQTFPDRPTTGDPMAPVTHGPDMFPCQKGALVPAPPFKMPSIP